MKVRTFARHDRYLLITTTIIILMGLLMVASTSINLSVYAYHHPFRYLIRQTAYLSLGIFFALFIINIPIKIWEKLSPYFLILGLTLLMLVLIPLITSLSF